MIDDNLELPATAAPTPSAGAVLLTATTDGDGHARLLVTGDDGATMTLPPEAPVAPAQRLVTPGFHGPTVPRALVSGIPEAHLLGAVDHDVPPGAVVEVAWRQVLAGSVGYGEVALMAGPAPLGNPSLAIVGWGDCAAAMLGTGTIAASLTTTAPIARGTSLWLVVTAWGGTMPTILASAYPDPIASGGVAVGVPMWRPSQNVGQPAVGWDAQDAPPPIAAAVRVP